MNLYILFKKVIAIFLVIFVEIHIIKTNIIQKFIIYKILFENFFKFYILCNL